MKKSMLYLITLLGILSCSEKKDQSILDIENDAKVVVNESVVKINTGGQVPGDNPISLALKSDKKISFNEVDKLYKSEVAKCEGLDYCVNLKHLGFKLVMDKGLANTGTQNQKEFYLNEQIKAKRNFPNIENFYDLLYSCRSFKSKKELAEIADSFVDKNQIEIEKTKFTNPNQKNQKKLKLLNRHKLFRRQLSMIK